MLTSVTDNSLTLVFELKCVTMSEMLSGTGIGAVFDLFKSSYLQNKCKTGLDLLLITNRKLHTEMISVKSVTLDDIELPLCTLLHYTWFF